MKAVRRTTGKLTTQKYDGTFRFIRGKKMEHGKGREKRKVEKGDLRKWSGNMGDMRAAGIARLARTSRNDWKRFLVQHGDMKPRLASCEIADQAAQIAQMA